MTIALGASQPTTGTGSGVGANAISTGAYNQPAGGSIIGGLKWEVDDSAPTNITDTAGNAYVIRTLGNDATNHQSTQRFDCVGPCLGNAANVITAHWAGSTGQFQYIHSENLTVPITFKAQPTPASGTSTLPLTAAFSAGGVAGASITNFAGVTSTANAGWTIPSGAEQGNVVGGCSIRRIDSPGGTYTAGVTLAGSGAWVIAAASYDEVVAAGGKALQESDWLPLESQTNVLFVSTYG